MTSSADFWARKFKPEETQPAPIVQQPTDRPWWAVVPPEPTAQRTVPSDPVVTGRPGQRVKLTDEIEITLDANGEYRPAKATHLKSSSMCPDCGSTNYSKVTASTAPRCFECGYVDGRSIADANRPIGGATEGKSAGRARQTAAGGGVKNNYHGNITTASEAVSYVGGV